MSRKLKRSSIAVEYADDLAAWIADGDRLRILDPDRWRRVKLLVRSYVSLYDDNESRDVFAARVRQINAKPGMVN